MHSIDNLRFLLFMAALPVLIVGQMVWRFYQLVCKMSEPEKMLVILPGLSPNQELLLAGCRDWLEAHDFNFVQAQQFGTTQKAVFRQKDPSRFLSIHFTPAFSFGMETYFNDTDCACLDTGTSGHTGMLPERPNQFQQSFPRVGLKVVWDRHLEAESYLEKRFGLKKTPMKLPYDRLLLKAIRLRMQFIRSIPLYPLRGLYWYAVDRNRMANRSLEQRHP